MVGYVLLLLFGSLPSNHNLNKPTVHLAFVNVTLEEYLTEPLPSGNCDLVISVETHSLRPITIKHPRGSEPPRLEIKLKTYRPNYWTRTLFEHIVTDVAAWWGIVDPVEIFDIHGELGATIAIKDTALNKGATLIQKKLPAILHFYYQHIGIKSMTYKCYNLPAWIVRQYFKPFTVIIE